MKMTKTLLLDRLIEKDGLLGLLAVDNPFSYNPLIDGMDLLLLAVRNNLPYDQGIEHVTSDGQRIQIRTIAPDTLEYWLTGNENRNIIPWLLRGEILFEQGEYMSHMKQRLAVFPEELRKQKKLAEFSAFLRTYLQAKQNLQDGNILDAHSCILNSLHHWAHISLIEAGVHPEVTVWAQIRKINPGIYKLYDELTVSPETLEQRVHLVLLACEFQVMSNMKSCCTLLLEVMEGREEPWNVMDLSEHPGLQALKLDYALLLQKLVKRGLIREVAVIPESGDTDSIELMYAPLAQEA
ncbi:nucleotidyltransferase-like protein [Paenibacillus tarimensis]|uniref:nucleotidyltransferase-like protein n=1 Tax=Paenibacillus tarimensis TaxID=416012 RepID=UPI001F3914C6|nr:nucleotidyltransferase-like protein [Paenibacillus tarimensis]MCF2945911.1 nucleotidyltransferase-like protein [Paenibacillus tarimensis]